MEDEDDDVHYCLVCNKTVAGLANYINHKKNECVGRKNKAKTGTILQVPANADGSDKLENQSLPSYNKQNEHYDQSENYGMFGTNHGSEYNNQSLFHHNETITTGKSEASQLDTSDGDFKKILSSVSHTGNTNVQENIFISTNMTLSDTTHLNNSENLYADAFSCNLSPLFPRNDSSKPGKQSDLTAVAAAEDFGILSASVSGNRNNQPMPVEGQMKVKVSDLAASAQIAKEDCGHVDDFFQSLELMSKSDPRADKGANFNQLPISNILNNLTFSDDEDLGFDFGDDMSLDSLSDDDDARRPPGGHTGGKWKPGEKPMAYGRNRQRYRGKWKPGERPEQTAIRGRRKPVSRGKNISLIPGHKPTPVRKGKRSASNSGNKVYACNFCDIVFVNRFQYSNHCSSKTHKEMVFGQKEKIYTEYKGEPSTYDTLGDDVDQDVSARQNIPEKPGDMVEHIDETLDTEKDRIESNVAEENDVYAQDGYDTDEYFDERKIEGEIKQMNFIAEATEKSLVETDFKEVAVPVYICTVCDKKFFNKYIIARHLLTKFHQNRSLARKEEHYKLIQDFHKFIVRLSPFQCGICRFYFNNNEDFDKHLNSETHIESCNDLVGEIQCTLCQFKTHSREDLAKHLQSDSHIERIEKHNRICIIKECRADSQCKFCGLKMHSFARLQRHIELKHADGEVITGVKKRVIGVRNRPKCPECDLHLASTSALTLHMRRRHSDEKPYKCEICTKGFADKHSYILHLKSVLHNRRETKHKAGEGNQKNRVTLKLELNKEKQVGQVGTKVEIDEEKVVQDIEADLDDENSKSSQVQLDDLPNEIEHDGMDKTEGGGGEDGDSNWLPKKRKYRKRNKRKDKEDEMYGYTQKDKNKTIKCNHCSFTVENYNDLRPHYMKEHSSQVKICELCDIVYLSEKAYKLHVLSKEHQSNIEMSGENLSGAKKYFQCDVCSKKFPDENYCKFHTAYQHFHSTTEAEAYKQNGYKSVTRDKFASFLKSIENISFKQNVECPECNTTVKKCNVMVHLRNHTDEKPFLCKICPKVFKSSYTLRKHLLKHFGCLERDCEICGRHFNKPSTYEEHMEIHAMEKANVEKSNICDFCGQAFYLEKQLTVHLRRHRKKDLKCDHPGCHWTFAFQNELNAHKRTHGNEKKYLCDTCGFAAFEKYHLRRHEKIHRNERKYHCEYCTYKAGNKTHLHRHMRIHIGSKPFKCPYCSFACNTHENIRKHILETKKHEGLKVYPCKFCNYGTNSSKEFRGHLMANHSKESDGGARQMPLSVFTGLFQKEEDLAKPAEGTKVLPCKERKLRRKNEDIKAGENFNIESDVELEVPGNKLLDPVKRNRRKRKIEHVERYSVPDAAQGSEVSQEAHDLSIKERQISYPTDILKDNFSAVSQPYPSNLIIGRESAYINNMDIYQRFQGGVQMQIPVNSTPLDLGVRPVHQPTQQLAGNEPSLAGPFLEQGYMKVNQEQMIQYPDYSSKYNIARNRDNAEANLLLDFQGHS